jgi:hypothetical protein
MHKEYMNRFFVRFQEFRSEAEQIVQNACDTPSRTMELQNQLVQLYKEKVGAKGVEDCYAVLMYAAQMHVARAFTPVVDIQQGNVDDVDSSVSIGSSMLMAFANLDIGGGSGGSVTSSLVGSTASTSVNLGPNHGRIDETMHTHGALPVTAHQGSHSGSVESMDTGTNSNDMMLSSEDPNRESGAHSTSSMSEDKDLV